MKTRKMLNLKGNNINVHPNKYVSDVHSRNVFITTQREFVASKESVGRTKM